MLTRPLMDRASGPAYGAGNITADLPGLVQQPAPKLFMTEKAEIRRAALKRRDGIAPEVRAGFTVRLAMIVPNLIRQFAPVKDPIVSCISPIGSEPDTMPMAAVLQAQDVRLALPVDWSSGTPLVYRRWEPGDRLAAGPLGIAEPLDTAATCEPDVVITPLAAFDRRGHRVGYGVGNVDRTLAGLRARKRLLVIGMAYATQEELLVPSEPHDEPLDLGPHGSSVAELPRSR